MEPVSSTYTTASTVGFAYDQQSRLRDEPGSVPFGSRGEMVELSSQALLAAGTGGGEQALHAPGAGEGEFIPYGADGRRSSRQRSTSSSSTPSQSQATASSDGWEDSPQVQQVIAKLQSTETRVRAHEAAHKAAGGTVTGPVSFSYTRGPDGKNYITGGEVSISVSSAKTPDETVRRMEQVIRAALAPADPSPQDRAVAAKATALAQQARLEVPAVTSQETGAGRTTGESGQTSNEGSGTSPSTADNRQTDADSKAAPTPESPPGQAAGVADATMGSAARLSRTAYGDPAVNPPQETSPRLSSTAGLGALQGEGSPLAGYGQNSPSLFELTPAMVTGFSVLKPLSLYA